MNNKKFFVILLVATLAIPVAALAAVDSIQTLMVAISTTALWAVFGGIAIICFIYSGILFLSSGGDAEKLKKARSSFIWGVAGVAVGIIAYSIVNIVGNILGS
jgi:hypothetical protein